jgi:hypothetical protein
MQESNPVGFLQRKVKRLRKDLGRSELASSLQRQMSAHELLKTSLKRLLKVSSFLNNPDAKFTLILVTG